MDNLKNKTQSCARIQKIEIRKLFNMFDYDIEIDAGNDVSVLIAPNGCGKTTIFNFISFILNPTSKSFVKICSVPFERFALTFSDGKTVVISRKKCAQIVDKARMGHRRTLLREKIFGDDVDIFISMDGSEKSFNLTETKIISNGIRYYSSSQLEDLGFTEKESSIAKIRIGTEVCERLLEKYTDYDLVQAGCFFITANRLQDVEVNQLPENTPSYQRQMGLHTYTVKAIDKVHDEINRLLSKSVKAYIERTDEARDSLLRRYLNDEIPNYSDEEFFKKWKNYNNLLECYKDIGLIQSEIIKNDAIEEWYGKKKDFLKVYLDEYSRTISVFDKMYDKLSLFAEILNKRNETTKKVIDFKGGELNITCNGAKLPLECLSSGEKNDIIMFYELIFNCKQGDIVLIDEPEISLHISWQEEYIDRLLEICKMNSLQAIIATHSPNIINDHTDLIARSNMYYV